MLSPAEITESCINEGAAVQLPKNEGREESADECLVSILGMVCLPISP